MSQEINYDELDQALQGAMRHEKYFAAPKSPSIKTPLPDSKPKTPAKTPKSDQPKPEAKPIAKPAPLTTKTPSKTSRPKRFVNRAVAPGHANFLDLSPKGRAKTQVKAAKPKAHNTSAIKKVTPLPPREPQPKTNESSQHNLSEIKTVDPPQLAQQPLTPVAPSRPVPPLSPTLPSQEQYSPAMPPANFPQSPAPSTFQNPAYPAFYQNANPPMETYPQNNLPNNFVSPQAPMPNNPAMPQPLSNSTPEPLGVRSPYFIDAQLPKRPLSQNMAEDIGYLYAPSDQSHTNSPTESTKTDTKNATKQDKKDDSDAFDWKWILALIFVVLLGALAGYLFYTFFADKIPF